MKIVFYDGDCNLCHWAVKFILKRDKKNLFLFAPLKGETAKDKLEDIFPEDFQTASIVLLDEDQYFRKGKAMLRICYYLGGFWKGLSYLSVLPSFLLDPLYWLVAKNRYRLFGKASCEVPKESDIKRFLP